MTDQTPERHEPRRHREECPKYHPDYDTSEIPDSECICDTRSGEERRLEQEAIPCDCPQWSERCEQHEGEDSRTGTDRRAAPSEGETPRRQWFHEYTNSRLVEAMYEWHDQSEAPDEVRSYLQQLADHLLGAPPAVEVLARLRGSTEDAPDILRRIDEAVAGKVGFWEMRDLLSKVSVYVRAATEDAPGIFTTHETMAPDAVEAARYVIATAEWISDEVDEDPEAREKIVRGSKILHELIERAATEDEGRTVYYARCGWCGAYEGTVDPREACAQDPATGEFIGPHQFAVYEAALTPEPTEETDG